MNSSRIMVRFHKWRLRRVSNRQFMMLLSGIVGIAAGLGAVVIKKSVHFISHTVHEYLGANDQGYVYIGLPIIGIAIAILFIKYIVRRPVRHGIPNVLYAISKSEGLINRHNMISSIIASSLTVGFGGSVGLEGPTVSTGAAIGSNIGRGLKLTYRQLTLLLGCASAAAMAAIFKAPIAAIVFAIEVIMLDLTIASLAPLLIASVSAVVTSYVFLGQDVVYPFTVEAQFEMAHLPFYVGFGIITGLVAVYFTRSYLFIERLFEKISGMGLRLLIGGLVLGGLLFLFPALYGEGYAVINSALSGNIDFLFHNSLFNGFQDQFAVVIILLIALVMFKVIAAALTFNSGGVGGIFAPTLFMGATSGLVFASIINRISSYGLDSRIFALIGMAGLIAGVLHAPLTALFLIAELSGGYKLILPLMIVATASFATAKTFVPHSVYTHQLARRKELVTHDKDKAVLTLMDVNSLIETDFACVSPDANLGDLVKVISEAHRNLFPVVDKRGKLYGMVKMDDIRKMIFQPEKYQSVKVRELMYMPEYFISPDDSMEELVDMFQKSKRFNIAVIEKGRYLGFISRAKAFTAYRNHIKKYSSDF